MLTPRVEYLPQLSALWQVRATFRKVRYIPLLLVNIVAGRAGHAAGPEATAALQQLHLVTMHVDGCVRRIVRYGYILCQGCSGDKGKSRRARISRPGMAQCAQIDLLIPGKLCRVNDVCRCPRRRDLLRAFGFDMGSPWAVALLTSDPENYAGLIKMIERRRQRFDVSGMTLQASGNDRLIEIR